MTASCIADLACAVPRFLKRSMTAALSAMARAVGAAGGSHGGRGSMRSAILVAIEAAAASVTARMTVNSNKQYIVTVTAEAIVTVIANISNRNRPTYYE